MSEYRELFSDEAEHALLGAMLLDGELFDAITGQVSAADFHDPENAALFQTMIGCHSTGNPIDPVTLHDFAEYLPSGTRTMAYAGELARNTPSTANWKAYAKVVTERAVLRRLVDAADTVRELATENRPVAEIVASAQQAMADLRDLQTGEPDYKRMTDDLALIVDGAVARLINRDTQMGDFIWLYFGAKWPALRIARAAGIGEAKAREVIKAGVAWVDCALERVRDAA